MPEDYVTAFGLHSVFQQQQTTHQPRAVTTLLMCPISGVRSASTLLDKHVEVILDQWDLEPGDDVPKFMERAVKAADRVLMICSEPYVRKANDGNGGAGYEAMIVTGELVRNLGTRKFIPLIRQGEGEPVVPDCVGTRLYVNFSREEDFQASIDALVKTVHQKSHLTKPALGPNPFAGLNSPSPEVEAERMTSESQFQFAISDPKAAYHLASSLAASGDTLTWRRLIRTLLNRAAYDLRGTWSQGEGGDR